MRELKKSVANVANAELYALESCGHKCPSKITCTDQAKGEYVIPAGISAAEMQSRIDGAGTQSKAFGLTHYHVKIGNTIYCYKIAWDSVGHTWRSYLQ